VIGVYQKASLVHELAFVFVSYLMMLSGLQDDIVENDWVMVS
jgi:hypothetical protein